MKPVVFRCRTILSFIAGALLFLMAGSAFASNVGVALPSDVISTLHYFMDLTRTGDGAAWDAQRIEPLMAFITSPKPDGVLYHADDSFDAPSAYNEFAVDSGVQRISDYILDADIPSFFFWPSSLRLARWTAVDGGEQQLARLRSASSDLNASFILTGTEHITITPDQHTGAYYSYELDRMVILSPFREGKMLINLYRQQKPSMVGRKGWVLGNDDEWNYLYTRNKGLNVKGLGWADTYMYDSFGITVYYQADPGKPAVTCGTVSWVKAGWAGINMVQPRHIYRGLVRVATAFKAIMEDPRLPDPAVLAETFSNSEQLPTTTLKAYARDYFAGLGQRLASSETLRRKVGSALDDIETAMAQMNRDELYAVLALDYFKKLLGRNPIMDTHPF